MKEMSQLSMVALELNALYAHEISLAAPLRLLYCTPVVEVTPRCREKDKSNRKSRCEHLVKVLGAELVKYAPLDIDYSCIACLKGFILHSKIKRVLLGVGLGHRGLLIIINALELLDLLEIVCSENLLDIGLGLLGDTKLIEDWCKLLCSLEIGLEDMSTHCQYSVVNLIQRIGLSVVRVRELFQKVEGLYLGSLR